MRKFATVLPTRIVQRKSSGASRKLCRTFAERRPARICCRMRNRLRANTPASMPERMNERIRQRLNRNQINGAEFIRRRCAKLQAPTSKLQTNSKRQAPKPGSGDNRDWNWELGAFLVLGCWWLVLSSQRFHQHLSYTPLIRHLRRQFQSTERRRLSLARHDIQQVHEQSAHRFDVRRITKLRILSPEIET